MQQGMFEFPLVFLQPYVHPRSVAATRLQIVAEKLEEVSKKGSQQAVDKLYGSFLMESRNLKTSIAALAEQTINVESLDKLSRSVLQQ